MERKDTGKVRFFAICLAWRLVPKFNRHSEAFRMGDVLKFIRAPKEDRKARFLARRERLGLAAPTAPREDLTMDHADPADTRPSELA